MGTILASAIAAKAKILVQDTTGVRWPDTEWLGWLNSGQREICIERPNACTKLASTPLVAGTKQSIPADGIMFLDFVRNMGAAGAAPGTAPRKVARQMLDSLLPGWHSATPNAVVQHFVFEPMAPKNYYCYPPQPAGTTQQGEILYTANPTDCATMNSAIALDDIYETVLLDYLMYRAYAKDNEFVGNAERSLMSRKAFDAAIGVKTQIDAAVVAPFNPKG